MSVGNSDVTYAPNSLPYTKGATATVACKTGFEQSGGTSFTCSASGEWEPPIDTGCGEVKCRQLILSNGKVKHSDGPPVAAGGSADVSCSPGFRHTGAASAYRCLSSGKWEPSFDSVCESIVCSVTEVGKPVGWEGTVELMSDHPTNVGVDGTAMASCPDGQTLSGTAEYTCTTDGSWSPTWDSACEAVVVVCPALTTVADATIAYSDVHRPAGSSATLTCADGFTFSGTLEYSCGNNGAWSPALNAACEKTQEVVCRALTIQFGSYTYSNDQRNPGSKAEVSCDAGYNYSGSQSFNCLETGKWDPAVDAVCRVGTCEALSLSDGSVKYDGERKRGWGWLMGTGAIVACSNGFQLSGEESYSCTSTGWSPAFNAACQTVQEECPELSVGNGVVSLSAGSTDAVSEGTEATVSCEEGFQPTGRLSYTCRAGAWSPVVNAMCSREVMCGDLSISGVTLTLSDGRKVDSVATASCQPHQELHGIASYSCGQDGVWTPAAESSCVTKQCTTIEIPKSQISYSDRLKVDSVASLTCEQGWQLTGPASYTCRNGLWSPLLTSKCTEVPALPKTCPALSLTNGRVMTDPESREAGAVASFSCDTNFVLRGAASARCSADGSWDASTPSCEPIETGGACAELKLGGGLMAQYSRVRVGVTLVEGAEAVLTCVPFYSLDSGQPDTVTCRAGEWRPSPPSECVKCPWTVTATSVWIDAEVSENRRRLPDRLDLEGCRRACESEDGFDCAAVTHVGEECTLHGFVTRPIPTVSSSSVQIWERDCSQTRTTFEISCRFSPRTNTASTLPKHGNRRSGTKRLCETWCVGNSLHGPDRTLASPHSLSPSSPSPLCCRWEKVRRLRLQVSQSKQQIQPR